MLERIREIATTAFQDIRRSWRPLAFTDLAFKAVAFAILTPATTGLLYWLRSGTTSARVVADADILRFFVTTPIGVTTLVLGSSLVFAITALECACLMAIGLAASEGKIPGWKRIVAFAGTRAPNVLRLTAHMVVRLIGGFLPFAAVAGGVYLTLLREHDINFYLAQRPPQFWIAAACVGVLVAILVALLVRTIARWALALPLVLFEGVHPRRALGESARRAKGALPVVVGVLVVWAVFAATLVTAARWLPELLGRLAAPHVAGSLATLILFIAALAVFWGGAVLGAGIANVSLFSLLLLRVWMRVGASPEAKRPEFADEGSAPRLSGRARLGVGAVAVLAGVAVALVAFLVTRTDRNVLVIAHRGASMEAPENTLAAFRLAGDQQADFVELDVQESSDGEVLVVHDADLMKLAKFPGKIWETDAATLRTVDVGSWKDPKFASERLPTLAEALAACKGRSKVIVELKQYGHNQRLEERVAAIVEEAGMVDECVFMSLDHGMVRKMKQLRPNWRCGALVAKAYGDLTSLGADFLAVEARTATPRFVRKAHRAGQDVYVWTVNDPAWMLSAMSRGVDGLITDRPDLARKVVARRAAMSDAQRLLVALMVRVGARTDALESMDALRP